MSGDRRKGFARLRRLAAIREERAQRAAADATRARAAAEVAHVTELQTFRTAQATPAPPRGARDFVSQREAQSLQARNVEHAAAMLQDATDQMERSKNDLLEAARIAADALVRENAPVVQAHLARWLGERHELLKV